MTAEALGVRSVHTFTFTIIIIIFLGPPRIDMSFPISYPRAFSYRKLNIDFVDSLITLSVCQFTKLCRNNFFPAAQEQKKFFIVAKEYYFLTFSQKSYRIGYLRMPRKILATFTETKFRAIARQLLFLPLNTFTHRIRSVSYNNLTSVNRIVFTFFMQLYFAFFSCFY
jgi:hypothetical protein